MPRHSTEISVVARYAELHGLLDAIAGQAMQLGMSEDESQHLQLVLEELFTNSIRHGYGADSDAQIIVSLSREGGIYTIRYIDNAPFFDPTAHTPAEQPDIGGLGIPLIRGMSKAIRYERRNGLNITQVDF